MSELAGQVAPAKILFFDQLNFPVAPPVLQLLFARDRLLRRCKLLYMYEAVDGVLLDELGAATTAMLLKPGPQIVGDPDIQSAVFAAGENVDPLAACAHGCSLHLGPPMPNAGSRLKGRDDNGWH